MVMHVAVLGLLAVSSLVAFLIGHILSRRSATLQSETTPQRMEAATGSEPTTEE